MTACSAGLTDAATLVYAQLGDLSATALDFNLANGTAKGVDTNNDHLIDEIRHGEVDRHVDLLGRGVGAARHRDVHRQADVELIQAETRRLAEKPP